MHNTKIEIEYINITTEVKLIKYLLKHIPCSIELKENLDIGLLATNLHAMRCAIENKTPFSQELHPEANKCTLDSLDSLDHISPDYDTEKVQVFHEFIDRE
jgi:hypothetical protein